MNETRICEWCGKHYNPTTYNQKYCSHECKRRAGYERRKMKYKKHCKNSYHENECRESWYKKFGLTFPCDGRNEFNIPKKMCLNCNAGFCKHDLMSIKEILNEKQTTTNYI